VLHASGTPVNCASAAGASSARRRLQAQARAVSAFIAWEGAPPAQEQRASSTEDAKLELLP